MRSLMQTMGRWAEGQNWLNAEPADRRRAWCSVVEIAAARLRRHGSLAELAHAYYAEAGWFDHLADEFAVAPDAREPLRNAAFWARLMEIRHPGGRVDASGGRKVES